MVYRWRARNGDFTVWSASRDETIERVKKYVAKQNKHRLTQEGVMVGWSCPYCDRRNSAHDEHVALEKFKDHLFSHKKPLLESGVHVADDISGVGSIAVLSPTESTGADNARVHFLSPGDVVVMVTTTPAARIDLLRSKFSEWPEWTVILTSKDNPLAGLSGVELMDIPVEIVHLDKQMGLGSLTETISRVLEEQQNPGRKITFEFDILTELIQKAKLQRIFKFLHLLTGRLEDINALSHFFVNRKRAASSMNVLDPVFDLQLEVDGSMFLQK
ncbi:MAG: hypothetical protein J07HN4v3_01941 [Halonotius sp. J07HN4]|jgi:hypothetical protein|nr:MAG: hypothetical protein J07HN4v3_01941 [Halonotius sp. J07HN4]